MSSIFETVVSFFESDDWPIELLDEGTAFTTGFKGDSARWVCMGRVREEHSQFVFYSVCPVSVPEDRRPRIAEFISRANFGMLIGNFELDYSDGEVRYKTSIDSEGGELTKALVRQLVVANVLMMDRYLPGVMAVAFGDASPAQAIMRIEGH
jgi:hypothetical protein